MKNSLSMIWLVVFTLTLAASAGFLVPGAGAVSGNTHIRQGQTVLVGDTIDITGVAPPYPQLAYWDGNNTYASPPTYIITIPNTRNGLYNFYLDPAQFANRPGAWFKYDEDIGYESKGNNLAFIVAGKVTTTFPRILPTAKPTAVLTYWATTGASTPSPAAALPAGPADTSNYAMAISLLVSALFFGGIEFIRYKK